MKVSNDTEIEVIDYLLAPYDLGWRYANSSRRYRWGETDLGAENVTCDTRDTCHDNGWWIFQRKLPYDQMRSNNDPNYKNDWDRFTESQEYKDAQRQVEQRKRVVCRTRC
jgi:hypothetical protein